MASRLLPIAAASTLCSCFFLCAFRLAPAALTVSPYPAFRVAGVGLWGGGCGRCGVPRWGFVVLFSAALQEFPMIFSWVRASGLLLTCCNVSLRSFRFGLHFRPAFAVSTVGRCLPLLCDPPRVACSFLSGSSRTPPRTASGHNAPFQLEQTPNVAAMRWRALLGGELREVPLFDPLDITNEVCSL